MSVKSSKYQKYLDYIDGFWYALTYQNTEDRGIHIGLPHPYISPSHEAMFAGDQFYWDSYFIILGLLESGRTELARGMVDNLIYLHRRFEIIPSRNRFNNIGISQIPFLTSMIREVYSHTQDIDWLSEAVEVAESELTDYWQRGDHMVYEGLSRYCDHYIIHQTAEHESGWDMTSRFGERCLDFIPIDLNSCLYKYEIDLAYIYSLLENPIKVEEYKKRADERKHSINKLLWNEKKGFYFDFDYNSEVRSEFRSLAGFYPMWAGIATPEQAQKMRHSLKLFEYAGGLANTQKEGVSNSPKKQWDYPNGWANQHWIVVQGLLNYGFEDVARRIATKWLNLNAEVFDDSGKMWERYDVVACRVGDSERYPLQSGFGWTNAIFVKLVEVLGI